MDESSSVKTPVESRTACDRCGHMHRPALVKTCACCATDINNVNESIGIDL